MSLIENTEGRLELIAFARSLRQNATDAEGLLWSCLRNRRVNKRKFRRQHPVDPYVLDFYCAELQLAVELDGGQQTALKDVCTIRGARGFCEPKELRPYDSPITRC